MKYLCKKCNSEFELEREAADIFCPYCGYLAKSDDRNTFYNRIHMIKPKITKKEFIISQLEKMARIDKTPKDVFDNLNFDVREVYIFYAERNYSAKASYDATVKYKKEEKYTKYVEKTSTDKNGVKTTIKEPFEEVRMVLETKVVTDFINCNDSLIVNFSGTSDKDLELIKNYKNDFEEDNSIEVPIKNIRNVLGSFEDNLAKANNRFETALKESLLKKINEKNANYESCSSIDLMIDEKEYDEIKIYCVTKYVWDYRHNNSEYTLSNLSPIKDVYGDYPADTVIDGLIKEAQDEVDKRYTSTENGIYSICGVLLFIFAGLIWFVATRNEYETGQKTEVIAVIAFLMIVDIGFSALLCSGLKKKCNNKKEKIKNKKHQEKVDRKNIMCERLIQNIKDDKYNMK